MHKYMDSVLNTKLKWKNKNILGYPNSNWYCQHFTVLDCFPL